MGGSESTISLILLGLYPGKRGRKENVKKQRALKTDLSHPTKF